MKKSVSLILVLVLIISCFMLNTKTVQAKTYYYNITLTKKDIFRDGMTIKKIIFTKHRIKVKGSIRRTDKYSSGNKKRIKNKSFKTTKKTEYSVHAGTYAKNGKAYQNIVKMSRKKFKKKVRKLLDDNTGLGLVIKVKNKKVIFARLTS